MRALLAALIICLSLNAASAGQSGNLPAPCRQAARLGGPCGCWASIHFFGRSVRELWPVSAWLLFPRASPRPGVAAIWPGRHVAPVVPPVVADSGKGTVTVADSWGTHRVSTRGLIFVDPYGARRFSSL